MRRNRILIVGSLLTFAALGAVLLMPGPIAHAGPKSAPRAAKVNTVPLGGPRGLVRSSTGAMLEGVMVQLISEKTSIRTTVFSNELGQYEFPKMETGNYTLRIPRPREFRPYEKESFHVDGSTEMEPIVLERWTDSEFLPPTESLVPQLSDAEWLFNVPGTAQEKKLFQFSCGDGCHSYQMPMMSRFDERSWHVIIHRMLDYGGRTLVGPPRNDVMNGPQVATPDEKDIMAKWLARVRGPESTNPPFKLFPRPQGEATRAIITEYELPWLGVHVHDVTGDHEGNIWFTINRSPYVGKLDPKTGKITAFRSPDTPGSHPGSHWIREAKDGTIWYTETWAVNIVNLNPKTGQSRVYPGLEGNVALSPDGSLWQSRAGSIHQYDPETLKEIKAYPFQHMRTTYGNFVSWDGRYVGGGNVARDYDGIYFLDTKTGEVREVRSPSGHAKPSRGSFDPDGNLWAGGRGGVLVKYDHKTGVIEEYAPPTPYANFYEATADKNGEVWAGEMHTGKMGRFNPHTAQWTEYMLPEPYSNDFTTWVDNTTNPVSAWYGDEYGYVVHVQPLD